ETPANGSGANGSGQEGEVREAGTPPSTSPTNKNASGLDPSGQDRHAGAGELIDRTGAAVERHVQRLAGTANVGSGPRRPWQIGGDEPQALRAFPRRRKGRATSGAGQGEVEHDEQPLGGNGPVDTERAAYVLLVDDE